MTIFFWVPESAKYPGTYALANPQNGGNATQNIQNALQFQSEKECKAWCERYPYPQFIPVEHGWLMKSDHEPIAEAETKEPQKKPRKTKERVEL